MNVLLAAYACEPNNGSEPEVGWQIAIGIANRLKNDNVFVITKKNNKSVIEKESVPDNLQFFYYELPKWLSFWKKGQRGVRTYYYLWMIGAALYMKKPMLDFHIVHHVTFVNDWLPSFWMLLKNKHNKFIWGPIGSNDTIEFRFLSGFKVKAIVFIRLLLQFFFRHFDPFFYLSKIRSDCIIGTTERVKDNLNLNESKIFVSESAIAMKKKFIDDIKTNQNKSKQFTIISVGNLTYIKNFKMTILSFFEFLERNPDANCELRIIGKGEDRKSLIDLVRKLDIEKYVNFVGQISLDDVFDEFNKSDLFLFPSFESAGFVFLEAMCFSLPVVALKCGGASQFVRSNVESQLVSVQASYDVIVNMLADKINFIYHDDDKRQKIGIQNKYDLIENFTWEAKVKKIEKIYMMLLNE